MCVLCERECVNVNVCVSVFMFCVFILNEERAVRGHRRSANSGALVHCSAWQRR